MSGTAFIVQSIETFVFAIMRFRASSIGVAKGYSVDKGGEKRVALRPPMRFLRGATPPTFLYQVSKLSCDQPQSRQALD